MSYPVITTQPIYAEILRHGLDYRIPLKHKVDQPKIAKYLNETYPELTYDYDRNMIILAHYKNTFERLSGLPNTFRNSHLDNYEKWKEMAMTTILAPITDLTIVKCLFLTSKESELLDRLINDPEITYSVFNSGRWYEFFMGSP